MSRLVPLRRLGGLLAVGFTLAELMVALVMASIILSALFGLLIRYGQVSARAEVMSNALNDGRRAITQINEDIRTSRYLYHYAKIYLEPLITVDGVAVRSGYPAAPAPQIEHPVVTSGGFLENTNPSAGPPMGGTGGAFAADSLALLTGAISSPSYVLWLRHPGPLNPDGPSDGEKAYKALWYRLIRLEMGCNFEPNKTQGLWQDMSIPWSQYGSEASRSVLTFVDDAADVAGCVKTSVTAFGHSVPRPGALTVFTWMNPHPFSQEGANSPYWVEIGLSMTDPFNLLIKTSGGGGSNRYIVTLGNWHGQAVPLSSKAYAQNVTMPGAVE